VRRIKFNIFDDNMAFFGLSRKRVWSMNPYQKWNNKDPRCKLTGYSEGKIFENPPNPLFQRGDLSGNPVASYGE